jgi:predicted Zn-dependent protease
MLPLSMPDSVDPRLEFTEWLHAELVRLYARETEAWATERAARVMARLNEARSDCEPKEAVILWLRGFSAFTFVGRYVYIARRLYERLPSDECVAFVLAHEVGHHDCGHLALYRGWGSWIPRSNATSYIAGLTSVLEHMTYGPEKEAQADLYAMQLCLDAGYDGDRCLQTLTILENEALDAGDIDGVFGPENLLDPTDPEQGTVAYRFQHWLWTRQRGYLPLRERRERAAEYLEKQRQRSDSHS